jgi:hypothetical protein
MNRSRLQTLGGELVIVVVGILIALAIDQALADRGERRLEAEYLAALKADFQSTVEWLEYGVNVNRRKQLSILQLEELRTGSSRTAVDTMAVAYSLALLTFHPIFPVPRATFDDLTGTGNLRVIRDAQLRRELVDFYLWVETLSFHERAMVDRSGALKGVVNSYLPPALLSSIADLGWNGSSVAWGPIDSLEVPDAVRADAADSDVIARFRTSTEVQAFLSTAMDDVHLQRRQYELVGDRARLVLDALDRVVR